MNYKDDYRKRNEIFQGVLINTVYGIIFVTVFIILRSIYVDIYGKHTNDDKLLLLLSGFVVLFFLLLGSALAEKIRGKNLDDVLKVFKIFYDVWTSDNVWIGKITFDSAHVNPSYNIYFLDLYSSSPIYLIENYTKLINRKTSVMKIEGEGIFIDPFLIFMYKIDSKLKIQKNIFLGNAGVFIGSVQDCGCKISSKFCQIIKKKNGNEVLVAEDHYLYKADLPRINKLRVFFGLSVFSKIDSLDFFYDKVENDYKRDGEPLSFKWL